MMLTFSTRIVFIIVLLMPVLGLSGCGVRPMANVTMRPSSSTLFEMRLANRRDPPLVKGIELRINPHAKIFVNGLGYPSSTQSIAIAVNNKYWRTSDNMLYVYLYIDDVFTDTMTVVDLTKNIQVFVDAALAAEVPPRVVRIYVIARGIPTNGNDKAARTDKGT